MTERKKYSVSTLIYVYCIILMGILSAFFLFQYPSARMWELWPFLFFGALALIATSLSITFQDYLPSRGVIQISSSFVYALFFLTHPGATASILILLPICDFFFNQRKILTVLFNIGQLLFSLAVSMFIWERIGIDAGLAITSPRVLITALSVLIIFSLFNHFITNIVICLATKKPFLRTGLINRTTLFNESAVITLGLSMAALWTLFPPLAILSVIPIAILFATLITLSKKDSNLVKRQLELTYINELALKIGAELDMKKLSSAVVRIVADSMQASASLLAFYDNDPRNMNIHAIYNIGKEDAHPSQISSPERNFLDSKEIEIFNNGAAQLFKELPLQGFVSSIILPISILKQERGILAIFTGPERKAFDSSDVEWLKDFGKFIHMALTNAGLYANLRMTQQKLIETEKLSAIGMLVSGIAHELNNPLTSIIGYTDLLHSGQTNEKDRKKLERIASEAQRAAKIVQNLSTFARESNIIKKKIRISELMNHVLKIKYHDFNIHSIRVTEKISPDAGTLIAEPLQIEQVFLNILNNAEHALKFKEGEKKIVVETTSKDGWAEIKISDNGPGISEENLKKIFLPFFTTKEVGRGTGLGLSVCYGIVNDHGGKIYAESAFGQGATFVVLLPLALDHDNPPPSYTIPQSMPESVLRGKRILVIDDELSILEFIDELLSMHGVDVETSLNGSEALRKIENASYDLIVTDIKMPILSGRDLYNVLKDQKSPLISRMLFMTGDTINEETKLFIQDSALPHICKPFTSEEFYKSVVQFLSSQ